MGSNLSSLFEGGGGIAFAVLIAVACLLLIAAAYGLIRLLARRRLRTPNGARNRPSRLGLVDVFGLDGNRQLVIVRRDQAEHLLLIGGPNDVVVESNIVRANANGAVHAVSSGAREVANGALAPPPPRLEPEAARLVATGLETAAPQAVSTADSPEPPLAGPKPAAPVQPSSAGGPRFGVTLKPRAEMAEAPKAPAPPAPVIIEATPDGSAAPSRLQREPLLRKLSPDKPAEPLSSPRVVDGPQAPPPPSVPPPSVPPPPRAPAEAHRPAASVRSPAGPRPNLPPPIGAPRGRTPSSAPATAPAFVGAPPVEIPASPSPAAEVEAEPAAPPVILAPPPPAAPPAPSPPPPSAAAPAVSAQESENAQRSPEPAVANPSRDTPYDLETLEAEMARLLGRDG